MHKSFGNKSKTDFHSTIEDFKSNIGKVTSVSSANRQGKAKHMYTHVIISYRQSWYYMKKYLSHNYIQPCYIWTYSYCDSPV